MKLRSKVAAVALAAACSALGLTGAASASTTEVNACAGNNSCASVGGVTGVTSANNGGADCDYEFLCLYTGQNFTGKRFDLYYCHDYALSEWNGTGSDYNNQTPSGVAKYYGQTHNYLYKLDPGWNFPSHNFSPVWYVKPC